MLLSSLGAAVGYDQLYLAPHLDDAVLSCGGRIALQVDAGQRVLVVTLCAGTPLPTQATSPFAQHLQRAWNVGDDPISVRRQEDAVALAALGCDGVQLNLLDAPYRVGRYGEGEGWRGAVAADDPLLSTAMLIMQQLWTQQPHAPMAVPLGVGTHVDHQLICAAGLALYALGAGVCWYEDAPYAAKAPQALFERLATLTLPLVPTVARIDATLARKLAAINCYPSQLGELFGSESPDLIMIAYAAAVAGHAGYGERVWYMNNAFQAAV